MRKSIHNFPGFKCIENSDNISHSRVFLCMAQFKQDEMEKHVPKDVVQGLKRSLRGRGKDRRDDESGWQGETPHYPVIMNSVEMNQ